jgi:hypothetical protein
MKKGVVIDSGKKSQKGIIIFPLELKIREFEEKVDYEIDETGKYYTILSERLKKII